MARLTFDLFPDVSSEVEEKPNVNVTKFGDGYEARMGDSINTTPQKWSLTFTRSRDVCVAARNFLKARGAVESFIWTNPLNETGIYVCRTWKLKTDMGKAVLTADFEEVFES